MDAQAFLSGLLNYLSDQTGDLYNDVTPRHGRESNSPLKLDIKIMKLVVIQAWMEKDFSLYQFKQQ